MKCNVNVSCARLYVQSIASATCCRAAIKSLDTKLGPSNTGIPLDKNRPILNCSTHFSDESLINISNTQIESSSPTQNLMMNNLPNNH